MSCTVSPTASGSTLGAAEVPSSAAAPIASVSLRSRGACEVVAGAAVMDSSGCWGCDCAGIEGADGVDVDAGAAVFSDALAILAAMGVCVEAVVAVVEVVVVVVAVGCSAGGGRVAISFDSGVVMTPCACTEMYLSVCRRGPDEMDRTTVLRVRCVVRR